MADKVILAEQTLEGFAANGGFVNLSPAPFVLTEGESYRVVWDGVSHECLCFDADGTLSMENGVYDEEGNLTEGTFGIMYATAEELDSDSDVLTLLAYDPAAENGIDITNDTHTVAIYQVVEDESTEDTTEGASIVLKDRNGEDVTYTGIKTVTFDTPTEGEQVTFTLGVEQTGKVVELALADGDQQVKADDGKLLKELTIKKPDTLLPENIRNGTTVAGVAGEFIGDIEETTVALSMADGDQVVEPSEEGKVLSKVTITKPETLVPENIAAGIDIAGIVGTLTGGGDGPKIISKEFTGAYTGTVTLFTADELAEIGFADATNKFLLMVTKYQNYCYDTSIRTLLANFISAKQLTAGGGSTWGVTLGAYKSGSYSYPTAIVPGYALTATGARDTMYYTNGEVLYNITNSTYKMSSNATSGAITYVLFACVYD